MQQLRKIKIGTRLFIVFGFIIACLLFIAYGGISSRLILIRDSENLMEIIDVDLRSFAVEFQDDTAVATAYHTILDDAIVTLARDIASMRQANINIIIYVVIGFVFAVLMAVMVVRSVVVPTNELIELSRQVAQGNLNINRRNEVRQINDEIGMLSSDINEFIDVIRNLVDDLNELSQEFTVTGDIEYRIDESKYKGSFKELVKGANGIIECEASDLMPVILAINKMAQGDFNITLNDLPGGKIILPKAVREIASILDELYESVSGLAEKAAQGSFEAHIDDSKFNGKWADLAGKLNNLMDAVAEPLGDIERNITIMSKGDFSHLDGEYPGTFGVLQNACNVVNDTTENYVVEISQTLQAIANGDLTTYLKQEYIGSYAPIKVAMRNILDNLNSTLSDVQAVVEQVAQGAEQISTSAMFLAEGAARQTAAIEELSSSIMLVHEKAMRANKDAIDANKSSERIQAHVTQGGDAFKSMEATMNKIKASSESITKIIDVISSVAFQTNLLALNASVEAARAGEHGKGFAVVADEVRSLAGRSQQSASETSKIIEEDAMNVNDGLKATGEVAASFERIANNIGEISGLISEITEISSEQLESISNINTSVSEIAKVVTDSSVSAEKSASASRTLSAQSEMLRQKVAYFKLKKV